MTHSTPEIQVSDANPRRTENGRQTDIGDGLSEPLASDVQTAGFSCEAGSMAG